MIEIAAGGATVRGDDPVRAAYDLLAGWGCRLHGPDPSIPRRDKLAVAAATRRRARELWIEADRFDPTLPAIGAAVRGLDAYRPERFREALALGYRVRVASTSFDDFLPPAAFDAHPEWFALRDGGRVARGNFALCNEAARAAFLDRVEAWLVAHPEVDRLGLWPEVTTVWDEAALQRGAPESYALLWREAAARFPDRKFEILATGLTLPPPAGHVPRNVDVRLRPGRDASGLQGIAGQEIESAVRAWEERGARVVLEIDAAPDSWCGMPWPCHEAVRDNARRFTAAVLRGGTDVHAAIWREPAAPLPADPRLAALLTRARRVSSWGHPRDAADLFFDEAHGDAFAIAAIERLYRIAADPDGERDTRRSAARELYLGFRALERTLPAPHAATYRRYRARDYRRVIGELAPDGVDHEVGPARVRETFDTVFVETDRLRLAVDRRTATVTSLRRRLADEWSADLAGGGRFFAVVGLGAKNDRTDGRVHVASPEAGRIRIELSGRLHAGGPRWESTLDFSASEARLRQTATLEADGGIAVGCRWNEAVFDRWLCPGYAREGTIGEGLRVALPLPAKTLLYCRAGDRGPGLALRPVVRTMVSLVATDTTALVATSRGKRIAVDWIVFTSNGELGR